MEFPLPPNEEQRVEILRSYGILDTPAEQAFDRISSFAARHFDVPICLISLIDRNRQFLKSCFGLDVRETPRDQAFCSHTILDPKATLVIEDAHADPRFQRNPLVTGEPFIRFYAGAPLLPQQGSALGSLCIIDRKPRKMSPEDQRDLRDLAALVEDQIKLHLKRKVTSESENRIRNLHDATLKSLAHLRENLIWMVPHELNTPLNSILGFAELLRDSWKKITPQQADELVEGVHSASLRMQRSVQSICLLAQLEIAASDHGSISAYATRESLAVHDLAAGVAKNCAARALREADLDLSLEPAFVALSSDLLSKAFEELLENAFKYSEPGDTVRVEGSLTEDEYLLSVADRGRGMTEEQIGQIDAFMQFERDKFEQQGWGIGLALVGRISQILNLHFRIASRSGQGVRATLRLPKATQDPAEG